jgi:hypothetical protein
MWVYLDEGDIDVLKRLYGESGTVVTGYDKVAFSRMIAKIAHSFAVAEMGLEALSPFELLLPDLILGRREDCGTLIGGNHRIDDRTPAANVLEVFNAVRAHQEFIVGRIRLLACLATPTYHAVVGVRPLGPTTLTSTPVRL